MSYRFVTDNNYQDSHSHVSMKVVESFSNSDKPVRYQRALVAQPQIAQYNSGSDSPIEGDTYNSQCAHGGRHFEKETVGKQAKECIGRESNPGLADIWEMATANFTTKPPMLFLVNPTGELEYVAWFADEQTGCEHWGRKGP